MSRRSRDDRLFPCDRRAFLRLGAVASGALALPPGCTPQAPTPDAGPEEPNLDPDEYDGGELVPFEPDAVPEDAERFPLAVQAGAMGPEGALLWGWATPGARVRLRVFRSPTGGGEGVVMPFDEELNASEGGALNASVSGLAPATWYRYAFFEVDDDGAPIGRSLIGRVRTAIPEGWRVPLTLACATCTNFRNQPYRALERMAEKDFDLLVHLGDMSYNDGVVTLDEYREKWRQTLADPGYRALLSRAGFYIAWDDHEITNNLNPEEIDPAQMEAAKAAFFEMLPAPRGEAGQLWTSHRWGDTLEVIVLDCRTERRPSTRDSDTPIYLSPEQMAFFKERLKESPCHFKVVLNSVPMTRMPELWALQGDRWQGYAAQREEVLSFLEEHDIDNVWFLSGDFHMGFVGRLEPEGYGRRIWEIAVGPSGNLGNPLGYLAEQEEYREQVFPAAQFEYGRGRLAATLLTFDPREDRVRVRFIDAETDETLYDAWLSRDG